MTLTKLVLHNYMIHRDFSADFSGNLIALTGEMGHGKSTFVGAIQFCLTGEHPPWHRDDLLSWGTDEGSAKLYFTHDGLDCSVLRKLHNSDVLLKIGDDTYTGARNVEKALSDRLGVDKDILKQIGFVQQYEIQSILFDDPGKRERSFQKLLGIGDANKIWTDLGPIIQSYSKSENFDASIESLKQIMKRISDELGTVDKSLETARKALTLIPSVDDLRANVERLTKIQSHVALFANIRESIDLQNKRIAECTQKSMEFKAKRNDILSNLNCTPEEMEKFIESLKSRNNADKAALDNMRRLSGPTDDNGVCPLCGAQVKSGQIAEHTGSEIARLGKAEEESRKEYASAAASYASVKNELTLLDQEVRRLENRMAAAVATLDSEKSREKWVLTEFATMGISPEQANVEQLNKTVSAELAQSRLTMANYDDISRQIAVLQGEKNAKQQQLEQASKMLEDKVKEKELSGPMAKKVEVLGNVRNWFHSSNGPRTMSLSAIRAMTGYVNEYLSALHSEIEVMPDNQGLSFAFSYMDGRPVSNPPPSTAKLSGGQKIELALAFRLAIYRYFGQKMGIMVLDEPTAHLSPAGITYFGTLLQTVSTLAKNMNLQIIMPTHEKEIMPYMDSEIHFD